MFYFLPLKIQNSIKLLSVDKLTEIRLRNGFPIIIRYDNRNTYLAENGATIFEKDGFVCDDVCIDYVIRAVTENSLYAFNDKLKQGFITTKNGVRIGVAGECVVENNVVVTIKDFSSLNIRIPHEVEGCSKAIYENILVNGDIKNTLIISPPAKGKTTILKDLARKINNELNLSILIMDERGEFVSIKGKNIDLIKYGDKLYSFNYGIRSLSPSVVITDELSTRNDWLSAANAANSGVKIIASCHGGSIEELIKKEFFIKNVFERYVVLKNTQLPGIIDAIFDGNLTKI